MKKKEGVRRFKKRYIFLVIFTIILGLFIRNFFFDDKMQVIGSKELAVKALGVIEKVVKFLPVEQNLAKEVETVNRIADSLIVKDGVTRRYLLLLQNNMELRPGGGFLGQYGIVRVKDGEIVDFFVEDANLLDQRITAKVTPPYIMARKLEIKRWKFRDSNWSPDYRENVEKAKYFYGLSGGNNEFDGVFAINAVVLNHILEVTGPIKVQGSSTIYSSENAVSVLQEQVEKPYLLNPDLDTQNRKWIMKRLAQALLEELKSFDNIPKLVDFSLNELREKNIMLNFSDSEIQKLVEEVGWGGAVNREWEGDYLMLVDANLGAFKSDYYVKRSIEYFVDLTLEKPTAELIYNYNHTATQGNWRTSDYHSYLRAYAPKGSVLLEREMVGYPVTNEDFNKTYFAVWVDVLINRQTRGRLKYELPESIRSNYKLLIQKQSGLEDIPVKVVIKTEEGEFNYEGLLEKDLKLDFSEE